MKSRADIKAIITEQLGLVDQASYKAYIDQFHRPDNPRILTVEERALLDPDVIDNRAFWEVAEEIFKTDPVANCQHREPLSKMNGNRQNLSLYKMLGFIPFIEVMFGYGRDCNLLEIGPGYGAFRSWIEVNTRFNYHGVDVYPKIPDVDETERTGLMSAMTKARKYCVVISSNVFQHLSVNQRRTYYRDVSECLEPNGVFMVSQVYDMTLLDNRRDPEGRLWLRHYGQCTEIQTRNAIFDDLDPYFHLNQETRFGGNIGLIMVKK